MPSTTLESVIHSTMEVSRKKLVMASVRSNALQAWAFASKRVEMESGGHKITNPLIVGRNPNITSYEYYDPLPMVQTQEFETIEYGFSRVAGSLIISDQEEDENKGPGEIFKLIKAKFQVLEESIKEKFSSYLYGSGLGKDPYGLTLLIPDDPTTGTLAGLNRANETQWRTSAYDFTGATTNAPGQLNQVNVEEAFDDIMMDLTMGGDKPDLILCGRNIMRIYRAAVRDKVIFALSETKNGQRMADLGFGGVTFNNVPMVYDESCPVNKAYFINSKYIRLHIMRHVNMRLKQLTAPWNVDAVGRRIVWQGNWCLWGAYRRHAVLINETGT